MKFLIATFTLFLFALVSLLVFAPLLPPIPEEDDHGR